MAKVTKATLINELEGQKLLVDYLRDRLSLWMGESERLAILVRELGGNPEKVN